MTQLLLDERIMWSVFLPIVYVTFILTMARTYYSKYNQYQQKRKAVGSGGAHQENKDKNLMAKCELLMKKNSILSEEAFNSRRSFLVTPETGYLTRQREPMEAVNPMAQMQDMMQSMGGTMPTIVITIATIGWINYTFGGILLAKVPFMLTQQFKSITQSGIEM